MKQKKPEMQPIRQLCFSRGRGWVVLVARGVPTLRVDLDVPVTQRHPRNIRMVCVQKIYQTIQTDLQSYTYNNKLMKAE